MLVTYNRHTIKIYDSIQDLPILRFQKYQLYATIDANIGSDLETFDNKLALITRLIDTSPDKAKAELSNIRQNLHFVITQSSPKMMSFVCLIKEIDGRPVYESDLTESGIKGIIEKLAHKKAPVNIIEKALNLFKKKIESEFSVFFPNTGDGQVKEFFVLLKARTQAILKSIIDNSDIELADIDNEINALYKPKNFVGAGGLEVQMIQNFERSVMLINKHNLSPDAYKMNTLAFYEALNTIKEQLKPRK